MTTTISGISMMVNGSAEWKRAWNELNNRVGSTDDWEYMGTSRNGHNFRKRTYGGSNRKTIEATPGWELPTKVYECMYRTASGYVGNTSIELHTVDRVSIGNALRAVGVYHVTGAKVYERTMKRVF